MRKFIFIGANVYFLIIVSNRCIKILGALSKAFSYVFHFIFPNKRFTIPKHGNPLISSQRQDKIPKVIWQTNYTNIVSLPVYLNYLFNRLMSPTYEHNYVSTEERLVYLKKYASQDIVEAYKQLTDGAAQADLWRLFVLYHDGGIYLDIDAHLVWPLHKIIESEDTEIFVRTKKDYTNYFMAMQKGNPILKKSIELIVDNIQNKRVGNGVYDLTGPTVINIAIGDKKVKSRLYRYTCVQGSFTNEYFQYIDKPRGKWTHVKKENLLKNNNMKTTNE